MRVPQTPGPPRPPQCCEFGWFDAGHPAPRGPRLYVDRLGFHNHLCDDHYHALVEGLARCAGNRRQTRPIARFWSDRGTRPLRTR